MANAGGLAWSMIYFGHLLLVDCWLHCPGPCCHGWCYVCNKVALPCPPITGPRLQRGQSGCTPVKLCKFETFFVALMGFLSCNIIIKLIKEINELWNKYSAVLFFIAVLRVFLCAVLKSAQVQGLKSAEQVHTNFIYELWVLLLKKEKKTKWRQNPTVFLICIGMHVYPSEVPSTYCLVIFDLALHMQKQIWNI